MREEFGIFAKVSDWPEQTNLLLLVHISSTLSVVRWGADVDSTSPHSDPLTLTYRRKLTT